MEEKQIIEQIRSSYDVKRETDLEKLQKLDRAAKLPAAIFAYTFGIIGALVLGTGMCLVMEIIGAGLAAKVGGIVIGMVGIAMLSCNYFIWRKLAEKGKKKYSARILELSDKLLHISE